jgi:cold shock CspA family protein
MSGDGWQSAAGRTCKADSPNDLLYFGTVVTLRKAFGFLRSPSFGREVFFHCDSVGCPFGSIRVGDVLQFTLESNQHPGKLVATNLVPASKAHAHFGQTVTRADSPTYGIVQTAPSKGRVCDGLLRYLLQGREVRHLAFSMNDISSSSRPLAKGDSVLFYIATDHTRQAAAVDSGSKHAGHAAQKAVGVVALSPNEKVGWLFPQTAATLLYSAMQRTSCQPRSGRSLQYGTT